jgi:uncharacterized protein
VKSLQWERTALPASTLVGLALPLIGMPAWNFLAGFVLKGVMERNDISFLGSLVTTGMALGVMAVVLWWEKKPLSALGFRPQTPRTIIIALSASIVIAVGSTLISLLLIQGLKLPMPPLMTDRIQSFPVWLGAWIVISSSVAEEVLFRGFVLERLGQVTGSIWWGALITLAWFTALHLPLGVAYSLTIVLPAALLLTGLYLWRRDLVATIIAHFVMNAPILAAVILLAIAGG